jgi:ferric-dicitrate binding protein FerR (iron transport regulator)
MNDSEKSDALAEAARWFARLHRGVMTVEARAEYEIWSSDPENIAAMTEIQRSWVLVGLTNGDERQLLARSTMIGRRTFARTAVLAFLCVVSLGVGLVSYSGHSAFWTKLDWVER